MKYRLAQSNKEDFLKKLEFDNKLNSFLGSGQTYSKSELKKMYNKFVKEHNQIDDYIIFCENEEGNVVGYIHINIHNFGTENEPNYVAHLPGVYVDKNARGTSLISYDLLKQGLELLQEKGFNKVFMNVQTHNEFRFLHYAIADEVVFTESYTRKDGTINSNKLLAINDISKLLEKSWKDILRDARKYRLQFEKEGKEREV